MKQKKFGFCFEKKNVCGYINCIYYTANVIYKKILHLQLYYTTLTLLLLLLLLREILTTLCGTFNRMLRPRYADARSRQHVITETIKPSEEAKSSKTFYYTTAQWRWTEQKKRERKKTKNKYYTIFPFLLFPELQQVVDDEKRRKEKKKRKKVWTTDGLPSSSLSADPFPQRSGTKLHRPTHTQNKKKKYQRSSSFFFVSLNKRDVNTSNTYVRYVAFSLFLFLEIVIPSFL